MSRLSALGMGLRKTDATGPFVPHCPISRLQHLLGAQDQVDQFVQCCPPGARIRSRIPMVEGLIHECALQIN
jgi:hypothetical protein